MGQTVLIQFVVLGSLSVVVEVVVMMMGVMVALVVAVVIGTNITNPIDQDNVIGDAEHIQISEPVKWSSEPEARSSTAMANIFVSWIYEESLIIGLC